MHAHHSQQLDEPQTNNTKFGQVDSITVWSWCRCVSRCVIIIIIIIIMINSNNYPKNVVLEPSGLRHNPTSSPFFLHYRHDASQPTSLDNSPLVLNALTARIPCDITTTWPAAARRRRDFIVLCVWCKKVMTFSFGINNLSSLPWETHFSALTLLFR